jgi:hypothetical protein
MEPEKMIEDLQVSKFENDGYLLVPQVLKPEQVKQLRSFLVQQFEERKNIYKIARQI